MRIITTLLLISIYLNQFACGGGDYYDGMSFYNLFEQTNISAKEFYPFLRDNENAFYKGGAYEDNSPYTGNINLWKEVLKGWNEKEIQEAVYGDFNWKDKNSTLETSAKTYLYFAKKSSDAFRYRQNYNSWNYDELLKEDEVDHEALLKEGNRLLQNEKNKQLKARYYYQIIRILHYSQKWEDAIRFYESNVEDKIEKNEIYYYILDQIAGCYYSTKNFEKAAYLFAKVVSKSKDRKKSAFVSFNFCTSNNAQGKELFTSKEDQKDLLLITGLRSFSDETVTINKFIELDPNDERIELLFIRGLNDVERKSWIKYLGVSKNKLPNVKENTAAKNLLAIAEKQAKNKAVKNAEFWKLSSSYLSFILMDISSAQKKLKAVKEYPIQKQKLSYAYEVFSWDKMTTDHENRLVEIFEDTLLKLSTDFYSPNDLRHMILDKVANTYYKNGELAKAFLVHNELASIEDLGSLQLLDALTAFYQKPNKTTYEKELIKTAAKGNDFLAYVNYHKGIYYLLEQKPQQALTYFEKGTVKTPYGTIPNAIFSNNIKECFNCEASFVMEDEVYKAEVFNFIKPDFTRKELAQYLIQLEKLRGSDTKWKAKLANYLLGNYYFNISNTGYFRGILTNRYNVHYEYFTYTNREAPEILEQNKGYNLSNIASYAKNYYKLSDKAKAYYEETIKLSNDRELNARCLYLIAKCELNDHYNNENKYDTYPVLLNEWYDLDLPKLNSFKKLKNEYSNTNFHKLIIQECSYFRYYSASN